MNDARSEKAAETYTVSEIYALEDAEYLYSGPLPEEGEGELLAGRSDMAPLGAAS